MEIWIQFFALIGTIFASAYIVRQDTEKKIEKMDDKWEIRFAQIDEKWEARFAQIDQKWETRFAQIDEKWERLFEKLLLKENR